jgi:hypothetical protein
MRPLAQHRCPTCAQGFLTAPSLTIHARGCFDKASRTCHECPFCKAFFPVFELHHHVARCGARPLRDAPPFALPPLPFTALPARASPPLRARASSLPPPGGSPPSPTSRFPCVVCGRGFPLERLPAHERACAISHKPRPVFDACARRLGGAMGLLGAADAIGDGLFGAPPPLPARREARAFKPPAFLSLRRALGGATDDVWAVEEPALHDPPPPPQRQWRQPTPPPLRRALSLPPGAAPPKPPSRSPPQRPPMPLPAAQRALHSRGRQGRVGGGGGEGGGGGGGGAPLPAPPPTGFHSTLQGILLTQQALQDALKQRRGAASARSSSVSGFRKTFSW